MQKVTVHESGPLFNGQALAALKAFLPAAEAAVADRGVNLVHDRLGTVLKHPTGYYESRVVTDRVSDGHAVTDGGVVYGPWLEGVSSRNQATRFKGYATFRKVTQKLDREAVQIATVVLRPFLSRMN